jgi:hypothetical protein
LNEARTITECVREALEGIARSGAVGEVVVSDNGSSDGSAALAEAAGARVIHASRKGYGAALLEGIRAARGRFVIIGDGDGSYDFSDLRPFLERLREGYHLVMGNRFRGGIAPGAMPWANRYIGNPFLSGLLNVFYRTGVHDVHCGIRGFDRAAFFETGAKLPGMEFASEMVIRFSQLGYRIGEVPVKLRKDGRDRPPHLRPVADGLRHLRTILIFSPKVLFLMPGLALAASGPAAIVITFLAGYGDFDGHFGPNFLYSAAIASLVGFHAVAFAVVAYYFVAPNKRRHGLLMRSIDKFFQSNASFLLAVVLVVLGVGLGGFELWRYANGDNLANPSRWVIAIVSLGLGVDIAFTAALATVIRVLGVREQQRTTHDAIAKAA